MKRHLPALSQISQAADEARARLFSGGDELTAATNRLVTAARATHDQAVSEAAASVESAVLLVRVANWRFLATNDPKGTAKFTANVRRAAAAISRLETVAPPTSRRWRRRSSGNAQRLCSRIQPLSRRLLLKSVDVYDNEIRPQIRAIKRQLATSEASLKADFTAASDRSGEIVSQASLTAGASCRHRAGAGRGIGRSDRPRHRRARWPA